LFGHEALKRVAARRSPAIALPAIPVEPVMRSPPAKRPRAWVAKLRSAVASAREEVSEFLRLFSYTRPYRGRLFLSWVATAGYAASGAILVSKIKPIFDEVLIQGINVGRMALVIVGLYVVKGACSYISTTLIASVGQRAVTDLRNDLYQHMLRQSFTFLGRNTTGSLMSHITTDVEKIQNAVSEMAGDLLKEGLTVLGLLIVLFYMDWRLAILSLVECRSH
jgi:subfamily B ATP-binding cassette protein MsbA